jgi:hypothetical protein
MGGIVRQEMARGFVVGSDCLDPAEVKFITAGHSYLQDSWSAG